MDRSALDDLSQSQRERLAFIDFSAYFLGEVKRADLFERFGVKTAAVTRDLALYRQLANDQIELESGTKVYRPKTSFSPLIHHPIESVLAAFVRGYGANASASMQPMLECEIPRQLHSPSVEILAPISRAIHRGRAVRIKYFSFSSGEGEREIVPFALANNGLRWHVRAYCRRRKQFIDFVLTRIQLATELPDSAVAPYERATADIQWNRIVELEIVPHPKHQKDSAVIAIDYGMKDEVLKVNVRAALAGYFLRQWGVDSSREAEIYAKEIRLWLRNHLALYGVESATFAPGFEKIAD